MTPQCTHDQGSRRSLLMVTHRLPYPPNKGERIRSWNLMKQLAAHFDVSLACPVSERCSLETWEALRGVTRRLALQPVGRARRWGHVMRSMMTGRSITEHYFSSRMLKRIVQQWHEENPFDVVVASCSSAASTVAELRGAVKVLDMVDVDSAKWAGYADSAGLIRPLYLREAEKLGAYEAELMGRFDHVAVTTEREAALLKGTGRRGRVLVVPNGVDLACFKPVESKAQRVAVFTGALDYQPNVRGVEWFVRKVWPGVHAAVPDAVVHLVGHRPVKEVMRLGEVPGVRISGDVEDVRPHVAEAAVAIAPIHQSHGIQNKILEAMAMGKAVITTESAAAGLGASNGRQLLASDEAEDWVRYLTPILRSPRSAQSLGAEGRKYVEEHHEWSQCVGPLIRAVKPGLTELHLPVAESPSTLAA